MKTEMSVEYEVFVPKSMEQMVFGIGGATNVEDRFATLLIGHYAGQFILINMTGWNSQAVCMPDESQGEILLSGDELKTVRLDTKVIHK